MKYVLATVAALTMTIGAAQAQSMNKEPNGNGAKENSAGTTGAMGNVGANGVATDPQGVAAQQGDAAKHSAGTVGAAPGADTKSQMANPSEKK